MKPQTNVNAVLARYIAAWPSLCDNRHDALLWVFTNSAIQRWHKGCPVFWDDYSSDKELTETAVRAEIAKLTRSDQREIVYQTLRIRREVTIHRFTRKHAAQIAEATTYKPMFRGVPDFSVFALNRIPLNELTPAWKAALIELADAILAARVDDYTKRMKLENLSADAIKHTESRFCSAQATANETLMRLCPERVESLTKHERGDKLNQLRMAAEALGMKLVPVNDGTISA